MKLQQDLKLSKPYTFWMCPVPDQQAQEKNFGDQIKQIGSFTTAREFWGYYNYMVKPDALPEGAQFLLFQGGINPVWEDPQNEGGGRFVLRVRKGWENRVWEELVLNYIMNEHAHLDSVCGLIMHSKKNFFLISIWVKDTTKHVGSHQGVTEWVINSLGLKDKVEIEYLSHPRDNK